MPAPPLPIAIDGPLAGKRENVEHQWKLTSQYRPDWVNIYRASKYAAFRIPFHAALRDHVGHFATVLDLGCNCGALMPTLLDVCPDARVYGIDIGDAAIVAAKQDYPQHTWLCGSIVDWLPLLSRKRFDLVTAASTLSTVTPEDIGTVLNGIGSVSDCLVLQEPTPTAKFPAGPTTAPIPEWAHDYDTMLSARGWCKVHQVWQDITTSRPTSVMVWRRSEQ